VQNETGIHQRKISGIIKKDTQLTFKAYLNQLRIEKAKALLTETDLSISTIAFESGYNSVSHFNRVFKSELQVSPQEFRLDQKSPDLVI
jgi:AraC-like DNA-binding protein